MLIIVVFFSSWFISLCTPAINGAYADYLTEAPKLEKEIEALVDFSTNIGYVIGPITAGMLADRIGNISAFIILGIVGAFAAVIFMSFTPKQITVPNSTSL